MGQQGWTAGPAPAASAWSAGPAPTEPRHAFTAEEFMPPSDVPEQTLGRVMGSAWDAIKSGAMGAAKLSGIPGLLRDGAAGAVKDQGEVVGGMLQSHYDQYRKAKEAEKQGRWLEMIGHSVAAALPGVGPLAASIGDKAGTGDIAGAVGEGIGDVATVAIPELTMKGANAAFGSEARAARAAKKSAALGAETEGHLMMAISPTKTAPWSIDDLRAAKPYLNEQHAAAPITSTVGLRDALDAAVGTIEGKVSEYVSAFPEAQLQPDIAKAIGEAFKDNPRAGALEAGLKELSDLPLNRPLSLPELDRLRLQLNAENKGILKKNNYDVATARKVDPGFAAREAAAGAIRDTLYDYLESRGVEGVRQLRRDEGSVIKLRNAADRQTMAGARPVAGSSNPGAARRIGAALAEKASTGVGAAAGGAIGGPVGAVGGAVTGAQVGEAIGGAIRGERLTRDQLIERAFKQGGDERPTYPTIPARPPIAGELPSAPIEMGASPDGSYVRSVPAEPARRVVRGELPPGREPIITPQGPDTSGRIPATLPEHYVREQEFLDEAMGPRTEAKAAPKDERTFLLRWLADDLREASYQPGSRMSGQHAQDTMTDATSQEAGRRAVYSPRVAGTPTQEMFHALGIKGTRTEIAEQLDNYLRGGGRGGKKMEPLADALREAWDGQRFDFDLVADDTMARLGIRRSDMRSPMTTPAIDDMPDVRARFFQKDRVPEADTDFNFRQEGDEPNASEIPEQLAKLNAPESMREKPEAKYEHGTSADFDQFKRGPHGPVYLSEKANEGRGGKTQAAHIAGGPFGGKLLDVAVDEDKLKTFDPLNDEMARQVFEHVFPGKKYKGWVEYPDMPELVKAAEELGYNDFRVREPSVQGFSRAITNPEALKITKKTDVTRDGK